jgi:hypothetical protein
MRPPTLALFVACLTVTGARASGDGNIRFTENAVDDSAGGLACYRIETPTATYFLEKSGAGLSSLLDRDGNDWLSFNPQAGSGSSGEYRGFPNAIHKQDGSYFHPKNANTDPSTPQVEHVDPQRVTITAVSGNGTWACRYDFLATHCTFTMTRMPARYKYWILYEGTPGGQFDDTDWWMTSAVAQRRTMLTQHQGDIPAPEWIAFGDARLSRALFLLHQADDPHPDTFYQMEHKMTVFGFGRRDLDKFLDTVPRSFSIGFLETTNHVQISAAMKNLLSGEAPRLGITNSGPGEVTLAWPRSAEGFSLRSTDHLDRSSWFQPTNAPVDAGDQWLVRFPNEDDASFYQLVR